MATIIPPPNKKQKLAAETAKQEDIASRLIPEGLGNVRVQFIDHSTGASTGAPISVPVSQANVKNLELLLNSLQGQVCKSEYHVSLTSLKLISRRMTMTSRKMCPIDLLSRLAQTILSISLTISTTLSSDRPSNQQKTLLPFTILHKPYSGFVP